MDFVFFCDEPDDWTNYLRLCKENISNFSLISTFSEIQLPKDKTLVVLSNKIGKNLSEKPDFRENDEFVQLFRMPFSTVISFSFQQILSLIPIYHAHFPEKDFVEVCLLSVEEFQTLLQKGLQNLTPQKNVICHSKFKSFVEPLKEFILKQK
jgi:hypothetical protein